jgi:hypothetical protein
VLNVRDPIGLKDSRNLIHVGDQTSAEVEEVKDESEQATAAMGVSWERHREAREGLLDLRTMRGDRERDDERERG